MEGADTEADILIQDSDRAPIDNRPVTQGEDPKTSTLGTTSNKPQLGRKRKHTKRSSGHKDKRPKDQEADNDPSTSQGSSNADPNTDASGEGVIISDEVMHAIKTSLRDDLVLICQQACQQAIDSRMPHSPSSTSSSASAVLQLAPQNNPRPNLTHPIKTHSQPSKRDREKDDVRREKDDVRKSAWLTKAARKQLNQKCHTTESDEEDMSPDDGDEDEDADSEHFSSTEELDPDAEQEDTIARFFEADDYQQLLVKCLSALDLKAKPTGGDPATSTSGTPVQTPGPSGTGPSGTLTHHPHNTLWGSGDYFPKRKTPQKSFPFPIFFEEQLRMEWENPATTRRPPQSVKRLYSLPKFTDDFLKAPLVDAPVLAIQSPGLVSQDGKGTLKDAGDRKIEQDLRRSYETSGQAIAATSTASIVARASIVWVKKLLDLIPQTDSRVQEGLTRVLKANSFIADATLDTLVFTSRSMAAGVHARRTLWLRAWQADAKSKQIVTAYPFTGEKLFGPHLDKVLVETRDKKKILPKSLRRPDRRGRQSYTTNYSFRSSRTRPDGRRPAWTPRPKFRRQFYAPRDNRPAFSRNQDRSFQQDAPGPRRQRKQ